MSAPAINYDPHFAELEDQGYTMLPDILSPVLCKTMSDKLSEIHQKREALGLDRHASVDPKKEKVVFNLHNKDSVFIPFIDHPALLPILGHYLDDTLILNYFNGRTPVKDSEPQHIHLDCRVPFPTTVIMMQAIWMIDDFTLENGATRVVPGSHKLNIKPDRNATFPNERKITGKAGSVFIYNSSLWHGASRCVIGGTRWGIIATYSRWFIKPSMDFTKNTPAEIYSKLSMRQKRMLGFNSIPPHNEAERISTLTPAESLPSELPK